MLCSLLVLIGCISCDRELETALVACRESIQKRFPDSVANLLYANVVGSIPSGGGGGGGVSGGGKDVTALAQAVKEKEQFRAQIEATAVETEQKMRSMRQVSRDLLCMLLVQAWDH